MNPQLRAELLEQHARFQRWTHSRYNGMPPWKYRKDEDYGRLISELGISNRSTTYVFEQLVRRVDYQTEAVVAYTKRHRVDMNVVYADGKTPLMIAVERANRPLAFKIVDLGGDVNFGYNGRYPINCVDCCPSKRIWMLEFFCLGNVDVSHVDDERSEDTYRMLTWYLLHTEHESNEVLFRLLPKFDLNQLFVFQPYTPFELVCRLIHEHQTEVYAIRFMRLLPDCLTPRWKNGTALTDLMETYPWRNRGIYLPLVRALVGQCYQNDVHLLDAFVTLAQDHGDRKLVQALGVSRHKRTSRRRQRMWKQKWFMLSDWRSSVHTPDAFKYEFEDSFPPEDLEWRELLLW